MRPRKWNLEQLRSAASEASSLRELLIRLGLKPAGGNYSQIRSHLHRHEIDVSHFGPRPWNKGLRISDRVRAPLAEILTANSSYQSYKLKKRLFAAGLKSARCELCGWDRRAADGRVPLELDHINGQRDDNRLENLRVLCPNCHSLQPTHRGLNARRRSLR